MISLCVQVLTTQTSVHLPQQEGPGKCEGTRTGQRSPEGTFPAGPSPLHQLRLPRGKCWTAWAMGVSSALKF